MNRRRPPLPFSLASSPNPLQILSSPLFRNAAPLSLFKAMFDLAQPTAAAVFSLPSPPLPFSQP